MLVSRPVTDPYHFTAEMTFQRVSGVCFLYQFLTLSGQCDGVSGVITMQADNANIAGMTDGFYASLQGQIKFPILRNWITANIEKLELVKH